MTKEEAFQHWADTVSAAARERGMTCSGEYRIARSDGGMYDDCVFVDVEQDGEIGIASATVAEALHATLDPKLMVILVDCRLRNAEIMLERNRAA